MSSGDGATIASATPQQTDDSASVFSRVHLERRTDTVAVFCVRHSRSLEASTHPGLVSDRLHFMSLPLRNSRRAPDLNLTNFTPCSYGVFRSSDTVDLPLQSTRSGPVVAQQRMRYGIPCPAQAGAQWPSPANTRSLQSVRADEK